MARRLRALPPETQPYGWAEFQRRGLERARIRCGARRMTGLRRAVELAAGLVLAVAAVALWGRLGVPTDAEVGGEAVLPRVGLVAAERPGRMRPGSPGYPRDPAGPEVQVSPVERWLASQPDDPPLVRVGAGAAVEGLEDRIAQLDDEISAGRALRARPARLFAIQQERAQLVSSLAQVRYAEDLAAAAR